MESSPVDGDVKTIYKNKQTKTNNLLVFDNGR